MEYGVVLRWWLFYQVLLVVGLPFASRVLPDAPDRGASLAMPAALVLVTVPTLWVGQYAFGTLVVVAVALSVLAASAWFARGSVEVDRRAYGEVVAVFSVAFAFLLAVQAADQGVYPGGGEKFLDFGILQSLLRADRLPPQDMWFAGERLVYYYGGHLMAAVGALLTGTEGRYAYSPALAGFYAMAVTGAYGLAGTIASARSGGDGEDSSERVRQSTALGVAGVAFAAALVALGVAWWVPLLPAAFAFAAVTRSRRVRAGVLGAFAFGFASNLVTPVRLLAAEVPLVRDAVVAAGLRPGRDPATTPETFSAWDASRVVENGINEFPLFAYLNGDLHGHMMSTAVLFLVVGTGLAYYRTPEARRWRRRALAFGVLPVLAGTMLTVNTWSFPTVLGVTALSVALADARPASLFPVVDRYADRSFAVADEVQRVVVGVAVAGVVAVLAAAAVWPFVWNVLLVGASSRHPAFLPDPTRLGAFLLVHGSFLAAFGAYLVSRVARDGRDWAIAGLVAVAAVAFGASFDLTVAGVALDMVAVAIAGPVLAGAWLLRRRRTVGYEAVLVVAGAGLVILVEFAYLVDNALSGRFNTIFKVYAQVWALWSIPAGVAFASLAARRPSADRVKSAGGAAFVVLLVVSTSVYGGLAVSGHFDRMDDASLDAFETAHDDYPAQAEAIEWLNDKSGQPHIASAPGLEPYTWQSPAASLTGIPTVAGWVQETIYRGDEAYWTRVGDLDILYETEDEVSRAVLLRKHDVAYVWVGPLERERWDVAEMADEPGIAPVFRNEAVTVYAVNETELVETRN